MTHDRVTEGDFDRLIEAEPRLIELESDIRHHAAGDAGPLGPNYCANAAWFGEPNDRRGLARVIPLMHDGWRNRIVRTIPASQIKPQPYPPGSFKERLCGLVGWARKEHPILGTEAAYEVAYDWLYGLLPNCRHEGMCWG